MLNSIQTLRALAAWLVVFHHYMQVAYNFSLTDPVSLFLYKYGAIGVDLFFVISGFVIYLSTQSKEQSPFNFAANRLARIVPAYWIFTFITAAILISSPGFIPLTAYNPEFLLKSLLFIPSLNPSGVGYYPIVTMGWTLNYEMAFYSIFFACMYLPVKFRAISIIVGVLAFQKIATLIGHDFVFFTNKIMYEFLFGIIIAILYKKEFLHKIHYSVAVSIVIIAAWRISSYESVSHNPYNSGLPCAAIIIACISQEDRFSRFRLIGKLGDWSYSTYLCHILLISCFLKLQKLFGISPTITLALTVLSITITSWGVFVLVERPLSRAFKKKFIASRNSEAAA